MIDVSEARITVSRFRSVQKHGVCVMISPDGSKRVYNYSNGQNKDQAWYCPAGERILKDF